MSDGVVSALVAFQREYEAELQVAFDALFELGWPPGRLILESGPISVNRDYTLLIKRGIETANDIPVFRVRTAIGGGSLRYWCGWTIPPEHLPIPSPQTIKMGELVEASWKRGCLGDGLYEDERPIASGRECVLHASTGQTLVSWRDEASSMSPAQLDAVLARKP